MQPGKAREDKGLTLLIHDCNGGKKEMRAAAAEKYGRKIQRHPEKQ